MSDKAKDRREHEEKDRGNEKRKRWSFFGILALIAGAAIWIFTGRKPTIKT